MLAWVVSSGRRHALSVAGCSFCACSATRLEATTTATTVNGGSITMQPIPRGGRLRTAGVSNFQPEHLDRIIATTSAVLAVNQIEVHPYFTNEAACAASIRHGVAVAAHSPLGQGLLDDPVFRPVAAERDKTSAQIVLRWHLQHARIVFPKSLHRE